jgi:hypothetical protein
MRRPAAEAWVCNFQQDPDLIFGSSSDVSDRIPGLSCRRLERPLPGAGPTAWYHWYKIVRIIEGLPL